MEESNAGKNIKKDQNAMGERRIGKEIDETEFGGGRVGETFATAINSLKGQKRVGKKSKGK